MMEKVKIVPLGISMGREWPVLIFKDDKGSMVPVWLDPLDAGILISASHKKRQPFGPHGGGLKILKSLRVFVKSVYIDEIVGQTQYASVTVEQNEKKSTIRVRASEVMSLAAFSGCEFFTNPEVIEKSRHMSMIMGLQEESLHKLKKEDYH